MGNTYKEWSRQGPSRPSTSKNIVVCCDGSWCGEATGTNTNVKILASAFAGTEVTKKLKDWYNPHTDTWVAYFDGVGVAGNDDLENTTIEDYFVNGALALDIHVKCIEAYKFIVDHFEEGSQVWLFGLSRGAYTARCVAGMIYNCGVLLKAEIPLDLGPTNVPHQVPAEISGADERSHPFWVACEEVYRIYRDADDTYKPSSDFATKFRKEKSWARTEPVVRFMGLFDTVGALGVPEVNAGVHMAYNGPKKLYDQNVAWEVQTVCQALALHDRMAPFTPCFVRRKPLKPPGQRSEPPQNPATGPPSQPRQEPLQPRGQPSEPPQQRPYAVKYETEEVWFPGSHYDIGRQRFVLFRTTGGFRERIGRSLTASFNILHLNINYTPELSNAPLKWIIKRCKDVDSSVLPGSDVDYARLAEETDELPLSWHIFRPLTIDAYDQAVKNTLRLPGLQNLVGVLKGLVSLQLLADRHIPQYLGPVPYPRPSEDGSSQCIEIPRLVFGVEVETELYGREGKKYRSRTYERWKSVCLVRFSNPAVWNELRLHPQVPAAGVGGPPPPAAPQN